jgi:hypothetical protein
MFSIILIPTLSAWGFIHLVLNDKLYSSSYLNLNYTFKTLNVTCNLVSAVTIVLVTFGDESLVEDQSGLLVKFDYLTIV